MCIFFFCPPNKSNFSLLAEVMERSGKQWLPVLRAKMWSRTTRCNVCVNLFYFISPAFMATWPVFSFEFSPFCGKKFIELKFILVYVLPYENFSGWIILKFKLLYIKSNCVLRFKCGNDCSGLNFRVKYFENCIQNTNMYLTILNTLFSNNIVLNVW